jgi:hypothetical protein
MLTVKKGIAVTDIFDISGPLRFRDVFSWYFLPKLERIYGVHQAVVMFVSIVTRWVVQLVF